MDVLKLSVVRQPLNPRAVSCFDIVLVHEFGGHAKRTWQPLWPAGGGSGMPPDARVLSFGYNETSRHPYGREVLSSLAERLLWELYQERDEEDTRLRPLVFVGREAGGFIIKKALVAARLDVRYWDMFSRTVGAVFFDTPHQSGSRSWGDIVSGMFQQNPLHRDLGMRAPADLLRDDDAAALTELSEAFVRIPGLLVVSDTPLDLNRNLGASLGPTFKSFQAVGLEGSLNTGFLAGLTEAMRKESPKAKNKGLSEDHHQVLQLLRPHKVRQEHKLTLATPGTCSWIEERSEFKEWRERSSKKRHLWVCGEMGCGKTYLARHIRQILEDPKGSQPQPGSKGETVAYCCLQNLMEAYRAPQGIIAWLLHDVINAQPEAMDAAKLNTRPVCDFTQYDAQKLWKSMVTEATKHGRCLTFIVDEIDQLRIDDKARDDFLKSLTGEELSDTARGRVRLLVLSRPQERLESTLGAYGFSRYNITAQDTQPDIEKTAKDVLAVIQKYPGGPAIAKEFRAQMEDADGMYLWARLALDEAVKRVAPGKQSAGRLAEGIFPLFDQYLGQFVSASGGDKDKAFRRIALFWLTYQARPMSEEELGIACAMVSGVEDVRRPNWAGVVGKNRDFRSYLQGIRRKTLDTCPPLVKMEPDGWIGLVHPSLKEYLTTPKEALPEASPLPYHEYFHCDNKEAHKNISSLCMDYLLQPGLKECGRRAIRPEEEAWVEEVEMRAFDYAFLKYAALYWIYHARLAGPPFAGGLEEWDDDKSKRLLSFGDEPQNRRAPAWVEVWWVASGQVGKFPSSIHDLNAAFPDEGRARVKLQEWLLDWAGYDIAPHQPPPPPRYDPPEALCNNLAQLAIDLFLPAPPVPSSSTENLPEPTRGEPPGLFANPDRGYDQLTTLVGQVSTLAKKAEGQATVARDLRKEGVQTQRVNRVLFKDKNMLGTSAPVFKSLSPLGQQVLAAAAESALGALMGAVAQAGEGGSLGEALGAALSVVQDANEEVKGQLRHFLLQSSDFNRPEVLAQLAEVQGGPAADLGLVADARLRARNLELRPDLFESDGSGGFVPSGQPCPACCGDDQMEALDGQIDSSANDAFLMFPGRLNSNRIRALIDTGGGCNLVNANWVKERGIKPIADFEESLVMADNTKSKPCPVVRAKWSFDDRLKYWENVDFVVVEGYEFDALLGLPFLKKTETIHNNAGRLVFPEYKGVHTKKKNIPLFHFSKLNAGR